MGNKLGPAARSGEARLLYQDLAVHGGCLTRGGSSFLLTSAESVFATSEHPGREWEHAASVDEENTRVPREASLLAGCPCSGGLGVVAL